MKRYSVLLIPDPDEGGYTVRAPALPGLTTEGDTLEEALGNAREAIELYLEALTALGEPLPEERLTPQLAQIEIPG